MTRTVVGLFRDHNEAHAALHDLRQAGFARESVNLIAHHSSGQLPTEEQYSEVSSSTTKGAALGGAAGFLLGAALAIPGFGPILAIGPIAAALTGAGVGAAAGGMLGALSDLGVPEHEAAHWEEGLRSGGSLMVVHADEETAERAQSVLDRHGAIGMSRTYVRAR